MQTTLLQKLQKIKTHKLGNLPVVVLPLEDYEEMKEELEIMRSRTLAKKIAKARKEKKLTSALEAKKILGLAK